MPRSQAIDRERPVGSRRKAVPTRRVCVITAAATASTSTGRSPTDGVPQPARAAIFSRRWVCRVLASLLRTAMA